MSHNRYLILILFFFFLNTLAYSQFRIRVLTDQPSEVVYFTVTAGNYILRVSPLKSVRINVGEAAILLKGDSDKLIVKTRNEIGFECDSAELVPGTEGSTFTLRAGAGSSLNRKYNGNLICKYDLGTVLLINKTDPESYIAGVVEAEGRGGLYSEFFKTQAVIARTYANKYYAKHLSDGYNLCDGTHCQVFSGLTNDPAILNAVKATQDEVIADRDSILIISSFHSNCGGETASSVDVWLTDLPYLKSVKDPFCLSSKNATWEKKVSLNEWATYLRKNGYTSPTANPAVFNFNQQTRTPEYTTGVFNWPLGRLRTDFSLRSTFFSVSGSGDSLTLTGRGYGHGVGLCQEGAIEMAKKGMGYRQIITFYFTGVSIIKKQYVKLTIND